MTDEPKWEKYGAGLWFLRVEGGRIFQMQFPGGTGSASITFVPDVWTISGESQSLKAEYFEIPEGLRETQATDRMERWAREMLARAFEDAQIEPGLVRDLRSDRYISATHQPEIIAAVTAIRNAYHIGKEGSASSG